MGVGMRVAHFVQRYPPALGGSEAYFARLSRHLADQGDAVTVFTSNALDLEAFWRRRARCLPAGTAQEQGVQVHRYPLWRCPGRRYVLGALNLIPHRTWQCLTLPCNPVAWQMWADAGHGELRFDVVHATAFPYAWPIACARRLAQRLGVPFLLTPFLHLGDLDDPRDRTRRQYTSPALMSLIRSADRVFVQTDLEFEALRNRRIPEQKLVRLGLGVAPAECTGGDRERVRRAWKVSTDEVLVGHLANNSIEKGTVDLLHAVELAWQQGSSVRLVLAGAQMPNFRRAWARFGSAARVLCLGPLTEVQKKDFFAGIDIFALPSRSDSFGLVLLEAWANGVPNVGYRAGGIAGVLRHEIDGLLVRYGDLSSLSHALVRLAGDPALRERLGACGQARIEHEFRWEDKLARVRAVYGEITGRNLACRPGERGT
jgi:glycosyltransferase involved in cell wall biosynthesis